VIVKACPNADVDVSDQSIFAIISHRGITTAISPESLTIFKETLITLLARSIATPEANPVMGVTAVAFFV